MILKSYNTIHFNSKADNGTQSKVESIARADNQTLLVHIRLHPEDPYHQALLIDQHSNILWCKTFKRGKVLIVDVIKEEKILIVSFISESSYRNSKSEYVVEIYDRKNGYKCASRKIEKRQYQSKHWIKKYIISSCGSFICFIEY